LSNLPLTKESPTFNYDVEVGENGTFLSTDEVEDDNVDPDTESVYVTVTPEALFEAAAMELEGLDLEYGDTGTDSPD
jgi:hypothetical protein